MRAARFGESAWLVDLEEAPSSDGSLKAARAAKALQAAFPAAEVVSGGASILIRDASIEDPTVLLSVISRQHEASPLESVEHTIEVVYDGADLEDVARAASLPPAKVIALHAGSSYRVEIVGFLPGFAYLADLDARLRFPRLAAPRKVVPKDSVGIAGRFTGIYPFASPGGWSLLGRAINPELFDASANPPTRFKVGDTVHFAPVERPIEREMSDAKLTTPTTDLDAHLEILSCAFHTTIQDLGRRFGSRGIPRSGPLDEEAHRAANRAVGNFDTDATIELPLDGLVARAHRRISISVDGEGPREIHAGETFRVERSPRAVRYLAVQGGIDVPMVLGSRANLLVAGIGGLHGRRLKRGDRLRVFERGPAATASSKPSELLLEPVQIVPIVRGPHLTRFRAEAFEELSGAEWVVSTSSDRIGARLDGPRIVRPGSDAGSPEPMLAGAVQIATDGTPIVLGPDSAVTGGYPVLAVLTARGRSLFGRVRPLGRIRFREAVFGESTGFDEGQNA